MASEEQRSGGEAEEEEKELVYKTKVVQFLGRTTPIVLQNDNGPCPLLAICNVLLLRNNLNLSVDISEISPQKLLSLVAERLIDSNSNIENKDVGYVENQQQNIADAIDLLPRLMTGIDVNIQFRRIDDFEFTRECAIFDLLDIPLYHGWIVDPQDTLTANAVGSKSYNTLMGELVALETRNTESERKCNSEEDCIDFAAATTATLGVPSPSLSRAMSFNESPHSMSDQMARKGDLEEEAELLRVLQLSNSGDPTPSHASASIPPINNISLDESTVLACSEKNILTDNLEGHLADQQNLGLPEVDISHGNDASSSGQNGTVSSSMGTRQSISKCSAGSHLDSSKESEENFVFSDLQAQMKKDEVVSNQTEPLPLPEGVSSISSKEHVSGDDQEVQQTTSSVQIQEDNLSGDAMPVSGTPATNADSDLTGELTQKIAVPKGETSSVDGSEPMYEGEDHILDTELTSYENREPMYEGEMVLAEQAEKDTESPCNEQPKCDITQQDGDLVRNFLKNTASQLTVYGLFCLQDGLKERELCVFFRNNHFSTMFKFNGELYLLATDQGYINQPDLVWEKLNEVNGDTVFMTGNFTEFKVDSHVNDRWNEQNAMANTADYLANFDSSAPEGSEMNSDLQLAIALQQQEFENQPQSQPQSQPQRQHNSQQAPSGGQSRLVTGPQVQRSSTGNSPRQQEAKNKDKCTVM